MTSTHTACEEVGQDLPPRPRIKLPRTGTQPSDRPPTAPTIDQMILEARGHRARCEALLEALGVPVASCATTTLSKES
jgi:hypothetical protein